MNQWLKTEINLITFTNMPQSCVIYYWCLHFCQLHIFVAVQLLSLVRLFDSTNYSMPGFSLLHYSPKFAQTHVHWVSDAIQPSHPLFSPSPLPLNLSQHQDLFQWVYPSHPVAKYYSFSFRNSPFNEYSGLVSFWMDWLDLLGVQGTLKSLLQHHSLKVSILWPPLWFNPHIHTRLLEKP